MDAMERSHGFESAVVSSLFNARQMIWTELSAVISDIKEKFDQSNKERDAELNRLISGNQSLSSLLKQLQEIAEGKELEINGLRRQLQSFYSGRPVCSSCSQPITPIKNAGKLPIASQDVGKIELGDRSHSHFPVEVETRKRDRRNASLSSNSTEQSEKNPLDIVSLWLGKGFSGRRPSEKRPCVRAYDSSSTRQPAILVKDTEATEDTLESNASQSSDQTLTNVRKSPGDTMDDLPGSPIGNHNVNDTSGAEPAGQLGITKLSPPSQSYDASLAIRNAVNHLDLANCDNSMVEFIHSQASQAKNSKAGEPDRSTEKLLLSGNTKSQFLMRRRFTLSAELSRHHIPRLFGDRINKTRQHKATCRYARHSTTKHDGARKPIQSQKPRDLDETGADLSIPSDFLVSEPSEFPQPANSDMLQLESAHPASSQSEKVLPSLGGSPTRDAFPFKRPNCPVFHITPKAQFSTGLHQSPVPDQCPQPDSQETQLPEQLSQSKVALSTEPPKYHDDQFDTLVNIKDRSNQSKEGDCASSKRCLTVKYVGSVERRKSVRREMPAHTCRECQDYYESSGLTSAEKKSRIQQCSRHRTHHGPLPSTPKGFWDLDISDCEIRNDPQEFERKSTGVAARKNKSTLHRKPFGTIKSGDKPFVETV